MVAPSRNSSGQAQERSEDDQKVLGPGRQKPSAKTSPNETQRQQCQQRNYVQSYGKQQLNNRHHVLAVLTIERWVLLFRFRIILFNQFAYPS